jgi:hypothetical protein
LPLADGRFPIAVGEGHHVGIHRHRIIGQVIGLQEPAEQAPKFPQRAARPGFFVQLGEADLESLIVAAMLARQFINAPLNRFSQAKIIAADGQQFVRDDSVIKPIRNFNLNSYSPLLIISFDSVPTIDQSESARDCNPASLDVGVNGCST